MDKKEIATSATPPRNDMRREGIVPVAVGQAVRFDPFACIHGDGVPEMRHMAEGIVESVNHKHRTFTVRYGDPPMRTCFQFFDIGTEVQLCRRKTGK